MIEQEGGRALAVQCDVRRSEDVKAALEKAVEAFGQLDVAFNNAGIEPKKPAPTADYDEEEWNTIIDIDLRGVFLCMKHEIPLMLKQGGGAIVNTSSGAGIIGIKGSPAYTAAKHGVIGLTKAAALDYAAQNIRINAVCPGYIETPMMDRYTGGTAEGRAKVISEEPSEGWAGPKRSPMPSCGCVRMPPASPSDTRSASTAARRYSSRDPAGLRPHDGAPGFETGCFRSPGNTAGEACTDAACSNGRLNLERADPAPRPGRDRGMRGHVRRQHVDIHADRDRVGRGAQRGEAVAPAPDELVRHQPIALRRD